MKTKMNKRLEIAMRNFRIFEKNCSESKKGFEASPVVCLYLIECILPIVNDYPFKSLSKLTVSTAFEDSVELFKFLDKTIERFKRVEHYNLDKEEIENLTRNTDVTLLDFIFKPEYGIEGQLEAFLNDLHQRLETINNILLDPRRNQPKLSYLNRMFTVPINQIAVILEALCAGITNV